MMGMETTGGLLFETLKKYPLKDVLLFGEQSIRCSSLAHHFLGSVNLVGYDTDPRVVKLYSDNEKIVNPEGVKYASERPTEKFDGVVAISAIGDKPAGVIPDIVCLTGLGGVIGVIEQEGYLSLEDCVKRFRDLGVNPILERRNLSGYSGEFPKYFVYVGLKI